MIWLMQGVDKIKQLFIIKNFPSKLQWFLVLLFSVVLFLSLGLGNHQASVYKATIESAENSNGPVKVVFYGNRYENYLASGSLHVPASGWQVETYADSTTLTAIEHSAPLVIYTEDEVVTLGLLHYANAGIARIVDGSNVSKLIPLRATSESVETLTIGGDSSDVSQAGVMIRHTSYLIQAGMFVSILLLFTLIALMQLRNSVDKSNQSRAVKWREVAYYALPLFVSTLIVLLAYWPGNVAYDASLQWSQAVMRGPLDAPLGITATLFMRLFTFFSASPAIVIIFQSLLGAAGIGLILRELRFRGISQRTAQVFALVLAILPQYATFFTNLGKDALGALGIIFVAWSLLAVTRSIESRQLNYVALSVLIIAASFAGMMRINIMPAAILSVVIIVSFLFLHGYRWVSLVFGLIFFVSLIFIPKISFFFSEEQQLARASVIADQEIPSKGKDLPLGLGANFYIYHLFSAAVNSGIPLKNTDTAFFYQIAPRSAWAKYDCSMTDPTFISISKGMLLSQEEYHILLKEHQLDLVAAIYRIIKSNPSILIDRQIGISKMLWYVGYGQKAFQATAALGYENVTEEFKSIAGDNRTLLPIKMRIAIQKYIQWSESKPNFWFFWKPALIFYIGLFSVLFYLTIRRDSGLLLLLCLPLALTFVMLVVIPFPAYRYQFPALLLMSLLLTLAFSSVKRQEGKGEL